MYLEELFSALVPWKNQDSVGSCTPWAWSSGTSFVFLARERPWKIIGEFSHLYNRLQSYKCMCDEYREHIKEKIKFQDSISIMRGPFRARLGSVDTDSESSAWRV